jgi:hypothetical protein
MDNTQKNRARLLIFFFYVLLAKITQWGVARAITLHQYARGLVDNQKVVILMDYGKWEVRCHKVRKTKFRQASPERIT